MTFSTRLAMRLVVCLLLATTAGSAKPTTKADSKTITAPKEINALMRLAAARSLPPLSKQGKPALLAIKAKLEAGDHAAAKSAFAAFVKAEKPSEAKALAIANWLVRTAILDKHSKLADAADRARFRDDQVRELRQHLQELLEMRREETAPFQVKELILTPTYSPSAVAFRYATTATTLTLAQLDELIAKLEAKLDSLREMNQMDQLLLQDAMKKQQQTATMMSSMMKTLHDTAKAIINNIKA